MAILKLFTMMLIVFILTYIHDALPTLKHLSRKILRKTLSSREPKHDLFKRLLQRYYAISLKELNSIDNQVDILLQTIQ